MHMVGVASSRREDVHAIGRSVVTFTILTAPGHSGADAQTAKEKSQRLTHGGFANFYHVDNPGGCPFMSAL